MTIKVTYYPPYPPGYVRIITVATFEQQVAMWKEYRP
jgi:hypothetical protein